MAEYAGSNYKYFPTKFSEEANGGDILAASNTHNLVMRFVNVLHFSAWVLMAGHRIEKLK